MNTVTQEHLTYLDELRESGVTNMFGAGAYVERRFPELTKSEARMVLTYWMENFNPDGTIIV